MRVNFNYFLSDTVADYVVDAVRLVARDGWRLLGDYLFDPLTGRWRHRDGVVEPPIRLGDVGYADDGTMAVPRSAARGGEELLAEHLRDGAAILAAATPPDLASHAAGLSRRLRAPALVRPAGERARPLTGVVRPAPARPAVRGAARRRPRAGLVRTALAARHTPGRRTTVLEALMAGTSTT